jgi:hypothetical protein
MIALTDRQLQSVMTAAGSLEPDRRDIFLQRVGVMRECAVASLTLMLWRLRSWPWPGLSGRPPM